MVQNGAKKPLFSVKNIIFSLVIRTRKTSNGLLRHFAVLPKEKDKKIIPRNRPFFAPIVHNVTSIMIVGHVITTFVKLQLNDNCDRT